MFWLGDLGSLGVRVFFVISGYLISRLLLSELAQYGQISLSRFYLRRTFRIFPAFYALLAVLAVADVFGWIHLTSTDFLGAASYTINYMPNRSWEVGHLWSLAVEEQFYLLWPAVMAFAGTRRALWVAAWTIAVSPFIRIVVLLWFPESRPHLGEAFHTIADPLASGCLLAGIESSIVSSEKWKRHFQSPVAALLPVLPLLLNMVPGTKLSVFVLQSLQNTAIAAAILQLVWFPGSRLGRLLNSEAVRFVGVLSYSLYLWQQVFIHRGSVWGWNQFPFNLIAAVVCALGSYFVIEKPFLTWRMRIENRCFGPRHSQPA